ncbi:hypothetical protein SCP_0105260 [Sparassis crispa]|uniref:F-box domain-containing protein n=1 Tax=Sparassis crispa TaxID=139825 RepID=A0A401G655_9APHY|nr:hypothetical protein SCP_0105260 [Sparassis crispa]GBE77646.1 hypothetical protein SCP_0105260 [Sparassis crispa]
MSASLVGLPPELYSAILSQVSPESLQQTVLVLTRAIPRSPIPIYHIFEHVRLNHGDQVFQLYRRLRKSPEDAAYVRDFRLECWTVDADIVVNLLALLPKTIELRIFIGPNFTPEHLELIFDKPMERLQFLSLRFRPYVQRATYYQFLKGAYFDSTLTAFSRWPSSHLPTLSIVQDPLDPSIAPTKFAQPLVFFRLDPLSTLSRSPLLRQLCHFRLRIPARQAARFLYALSGALPNIELLDMSTCNISEADVEGLLGRLVRLKALVLDGCPIVGQRADVQGQDADGVGQWAALGKAMALAGVKHAKDREKKLKAWLEAHHARTEAREAAETVPNQAAPRRPRRGRRGLATATISLRASPPQDSVALPIVNNIPDNGQPVPPRNQKIRILPFIPSLRFVAATAPSSIGFDKHAALRADFERGWAEGIAQISAARNRLKQSWSNGVRVVKFSMADSEDEEAGEVGLAGLQDIGDPRAFVVTLGGGAGGSEDTDVDEGKCPLLCLAGPGRNGGHAEGCAHELGWRVWQDEL